MDSGQLLLPHFNVDRFGLIFFELDDKGRIIEDARGYRVVIDDQRVYWVEPDGIHQLENSISGVTVEDLENDERLIKLSSDYRIEIQNENQILRKNVSDLQEQLGNCCIRLKEVTEVLYKIEVQGLLDDELKWFSPKGGSE